MFEKLKQNESLTVYKPEVLIFPTPQEVDMYAAKIFIAQVKLKPNSVLTLPTSSTPEGMYRLVVQTYKELGLEFSQLTIFNLDEYWPLAPNHEASYASYMERNLFQYVNIPPSQRYIPNCYADDPQIEAERYEELLRQNPVDLAILGIGPGTTCHIGFNERGSSVNSRTRYVLLDEQTRKANARFFPNPEAMPLGAITQGIGNILETGSIMLLAKGENKAWGIQRTLEGPIGNEAPASYLRLHPHVTFVLDQQAAKLLNTSAA